jgi:sugar phosphate isomerase/epimerase
MRLEILRTLWGVVDEYADADGVDSALRAVAATGLYDGVVAPLFNVPDPPVLVEAAAGHGLTVVPQVFTWGRTVDDHLDTFSASLRQAVEATKPRFVIAQAGRDAFSDADADRFFTEALALERDLGTPVAFETHRQRILFSPWRTRDLLARFDDLKVNCDFSHFVCVAERLNFGRDVVTACAGRALHFDARVGHEEAPQVHDPRAPEHQRHLDAHLAWWDEIWDDQERRGLEVVSCMPEFGPPPYQPIDPATGRPIGDRDEINDWMAALLRARFDGRPDATTTVTK